MGGTQVQREAAPVLRISRKKGSFLGPPHVHDSVKEWYFLYLGTKYGGKKSPYIYALSKNWKGSVSPHGDRHP